MPMRRLTLVVLLAVTVAFPLSVAAQPSFVDVTEQSGLSGGRQAAWADYDADGWVDVLIGATLFRNQEGQRFEQVALPEGVGGTSGTWGDCDNDGDLDLFTFGGSFALALNNGDGTFTASDGLPEEVPVVSSRGSCWVDLNADGLLDIYVGGYEKWEDRIYLDAILINEGDGTFSLAWQSTEEDMLSARGVTAADFDQDGDSDVYVSNYRLQPNRMWLNTGDLPMTDVAPDRGAAGVAKSPIDYMGVRYPVSGHTIGSAWGDLDDDGHIDLFVGNFSHPPDYQDRPQFLRNTGAPDWAFEDVSADAGLAWQESFASPALADVDNDGDLDLYFTTVYGGDHSVLYLNEGDWSFRDVTAEAGISAAKTYQAAWADYDRDGDLDLLTGGKLYENRIEGGSFLRVKLRGDGSAVGAVARVQMGERALTRHVESSTGEGNQNEMTLHFGLGEYEGPVTVEITWPGGETQTYQAYSGWCVTVEQE
ncbi:MAG: hypothetical protein GF393_10290 [Armatimonadia bacterium]|nr:hypothetical protein [Armatimonadia bacterium]